MRVVGVARRRVRTRARRERRLGAGRALRSTSVSDQRQIMRKTTPSAAALRRRPACCHNPHTHPPKIFSVFFLFFSFCLVRGGRGREAAWRGAARKHLPVIAARSLSTSPTCLSANAAPRAARPRPAACMYPTIGRALGRPAAGGDCWYPICRVRVQQLHSTEFSAFAHIRPCSKNSIADGPTLAVRSRAPRTRRGRVAGMPHRLSTRPSHLCSTQ